MIPAAELVDFVVRRLVHHEDELRLETVEEEDGGVIRLTMNQEDVGRVIGRNGRTIKALRTLVSTAAGGSEKAVRVEVAE
ncbi:MAG: KH domain-containing protein [Candidatus Hydrogenedentes bacterium]|nr:KH domain-containing protein [Candidatus Hydrogenedentota bacterium]